MDPQPSPTPTDIALQLSRDTYYQVVHTLRTSLPSPVTDTPEDADRRDRAVIARIASLLPATPDEANIAAQYVAAGAQALDCQRLARQFPNDPELILKCTAQCASMMRNARSWLNVLLRSQAAREKRDGDSTAAAQAAATERNALALMADALLQTPPAQPAPAAPTPGPIAEAERYALLHRKRATLIRRLGRLPEKINVGPIPPEIVQALITGTTPILRSLDKTPLAPGALAA